ncbi:MAG: hypothetical protein JKY69_04990, partial [Flavobacteriaceae bacterium]|nr:hypothetical protein [Flavobacteriaceae bacterium]
MISQSAFQEVYSDSKIQYKKQLFGAIETFEHSTVATDELYNVTFTFVGNNKGDYVLDTTKAIGNIFKYAGTNLGNYNPIIRLAAPSKYQIAVINANYQPNIKTTLSAEIAISNNDLNLFSSIDDAQNKGIASKLNWKQLFTDKKWRFSTDFDFEFVHQNFNTEQRFETVEFQRDWNLFNPIGNKQLLNTSFILQKDKNNFVKYGFNYLEYSENYSGVKHTFQGKVRSNKTLFFVDG